MLGVWHAHILTHSYTLHDDAYSRDNAQTPLYGMSHVPSDTHTFSPLPPSPPIHTQTYSHTYTHPPTPTPIGWRNKTVITKINLTFCPSCEVRLMKRWRRMHHLGHTVYRSWCSLPWDTRCWTLASNFHHLQLRVKGIRSTDAGACTPAGVRVHLLTLRYVLLKYFSLKPLSPLEALIHCTH